MGNGHSNGGSNAPNNRMAISAVAESMKITKPQMLELRDACMQYTTTGKGDDPSAPTISRRDFRIAMEEAGVAEKDDGEILDRLFTMWDKTGDDRVDTILFMTGVSPLACVLDVPSKLEFAFEVFDVDGTGTLGHSDMESMLAAINATASYFGDAVITSQQIEIIVEDVFKSATSAVMKEKIKYADHIDEIAKHPLVVQFASGGGTMRYGTK